MGKVKGRGCTADLGKAIRPTDRGALEQRLSVRIPPGNCPGPSSPLELSCWLRVARKESGWKAEAEPGVLRAGGHQLTALPWLKGQSLL